MFRDSSQLALPLPMKHVTDQLREIFVDLTIWIPLTLTVGAFALGLMALFVEACDRI